MTETVKKRGGCLKTFGILAAGGVGAVILIGIMASDDDGKSAPAATGVVAAPVPAMKVSARELSNAYEANEVKAQSLYGDQALEVSGTVAGITLGMLDEPVLQLEGSNQFMPVQASFAKSDKAALANIDKGDRITIHCGKITEVIATPMLRDCRL